MLVSWLLTSRDDSYIFFPSPDLSSYFSSQIYYLKPDTSQRSDYTTDQTYIPQTAPFPLTSYSLLYVCIYCSCVVPVSMCVYMEARGQPQELLTSCLQAGSLIGSELTDWTWPLGQKLQGSFCLHFLVLGLQVANPARDLFLFAGVWTQVPELVWTVL